MHHESEVTAEILLRAYACGVFPMAEARDDDMLQWLSPDPRAIIPLDGFHLSRSLARTVRRGRFTVTVDRAFHDVIEGCARRPDTWISYGLQALYEQLHELGHAHSVEVWRNGQLAGGLYGVALGGAFFGESMFSAERDASKVALVHLVARLRAGGFTLLDTQFNTPHLQGLGAIDVPRLRYLQLLHVALRRGGDFARLPEDTTPDEILKLSGYRPAPADAPRG